MPVDALKTTLQAEGQQAVPLLAGKVRASGVQVLWHGAGAAYSATAVGHFPWFFTFNLLQARLPDASQPHTKLARYNNAQISYVIPSYLPLGTRQSVLCPALCPILCRIPCEW